MLKVGAKGGKGGAVRCVVGRELASLCWTGCRGEGGVLIPGSVIGVLVVCRVRQPVRVVC